MEQDIDSLSKRQKLILKAIIDSHISNGEPVGSKYLLQSEQLKCSSATIRNDMAELERLGFLEQPHASSGRVPSEKGYRFYVDSLIEHYAMTAREIAVINQQLKNKMGELDQILMTASKIASNLTNYTGIAVKPKASSVTVTKFEAIAIDSHSFLLVMLDREGQAKTKRIKLDVEINNEVCEDLSRALNRNISGLTVNEITLPKIMEVEALMGEYSGIVNPIIKIVYEVMNEMDSGELKFSGVNRLLQYPEFNDVEKLQELLGKFEEEDEIIDLVSGTEGDDISVVIGSESSVRVMNNSSLVFKPIVKDGKTLGAIGIIGPRRMDYAKVLATLEGLSQNIVGLLDEKQLLGDGGDNNGGK